jgi:hypothetical protein
MNVLDGMYGSCDFKNLRKRCSYQLNYFSGFLGTFREGVSHEAYFMMLTGLGLGAGGAIRFLGRPLARVVCDR